MQALRGEPPGAHYPSSAVCQIRRWGGAKWSGALNSATTAWGRALRAEPVGASAIASWAQLRPPGPPAASTSLLGTQGVVGGREGQRVALCLAELDVGTPEATMCVHYVHPCVCARKHVCT